MGSACAKAGVTAIDPSDEQNGSSDRQKPVTKSLGNSAQVNRRASERRGLRHGLVHAGRRVWDHYTVEREVGHGMTGKVYLVRSKDSGELFALKSMDLRRLDVTSHELLEDLKAEVETLRGLDHPHVIKLYEYFVEPATGGPVQSMYLVLEYCSGGELFDKLHAQPGSRFQEHEAAYLINQMVAAVAYIHSQGITHRDLKLENFIFTDNADMMHSGIKLIDFGLSARYSYSGGGVRRMTTLCGTPYYLAPEVLNQSEGAGGYTNAVDEWSLGVITYMLLSGTPPFKGRRDREVLQAVRRGKYTLSGPRWEGISEEAKDFIRRLLVYNPGKRSTSEQAMKHPWLVAARARQGRAPAPLDADIVNSLREYRTMTVFKRAALEAIAFSMSGPSLSHMREAFARVDTGGSGSVTVDMFVHVLKDAGISKEEATAIFKSIAPPGSATMSYSEFLAATLNKRTLRDATVRAAFSRMDVDSSGFITRENLRSVMGDDWTPAVEDAFFKEADTNGDGVISADEFVAALTRAFGPVLRAGPPPLPEPPKSGMGGVPMPAMPAPMAPTGPQFDGQVSAMPGVMPYPTAGVPMSLPVGPPLPPGTTALSAGTGGTPNTIDISTGHTPPLAAVAGQGPARSRQASVATRQGSMAGVPSQGQVDTGAPNANGASFAAAKAGGMSFRTGAGRPRTGSDDDVQLLHAAGGQETLAGEQTGEPLQIAVDGQGVPGAPIGLGLPIMGAGLGGIGIGMGSTIDTTVQQVHHPS